MVALLLDDNSDGFELLSWACQASVFNSVGKSLLTSKDSHDILYYMKQSI